MIEAQAALASIKKVDEALGVIGKLLTKLKGQPDVAALKLAEALDEVARTWQVMDESVTNFMRLGIDPEALEQGSEVLLRIEGGGLRVKVEQGRGHCHVIGNIFQKYLDRWFQRVLKGRDLDAIREVFYMLANADDDVFDDMERLVEQLQIEANAVLEMMIKKQVPQAQERVLALRGVLHPFRLAIADALTKLYGLKSKFIVLATIA